MVFGSEKKDLSQYFEARPDRLLRLQVKDGADKEKIRLSLFAMGLKEEIVWQDATHLARRIVRERLTEDD